VQAHRDMTSAGAKVASASVAADTRHEGQSHGSRPRTSSHGEAAQAPAASIVIKHDAGELTKPIADVVTALSQHMQSHTAALGEHMKAHTAAVGEMAKAMTAPKRVVKDKAGRVVGVETVQ